MPVRHTYGTAGATGGGYSAQPGSLQENFSENRYDTRPGYSWQRRSAKTNKDRNAWRSGWSFGVSLISGSDSGEYGVEGEEAMYEPYSCDGEGTQSLKWILGQCLDVSGNPAAGAIVQCFRTSDDLFTGEVNANSTDGKYAVPTPYAGVNHYVVAYKAGSPDIGGTTVNTLTPTNIDGT